MCSMLLVNQVGGMKVFCVTSKSGGRCEGFLCYQRVRWEV